MRNLVLTALVLTVAVAVAQAVPTYMVSITTSGANWSLWCTQDASSTANDGLASFTVDMMATGGTVITKSTMKAPKFQYDPDALLNAGFVSTFNSNGTLVGGNVTGIIGAQGTLYDGGNNPDKDILVIRGVGQVAGQGHDINGDVVGSPWANPVLLATGTFTGIGTFTVPTSANGLIQGSALNSGWTGPGNVTPINFIPEPATMSLLVLGGLAALRRRRA